MASESTSKGSITGTELIDAAQRGEQVVCPKCGAKLLVALDDETAAKHKVHRGIYCPHDIKHVSVYVEARGEAGFWEQFQKRS